MKRRFQWVLGEKQGKIENYKRTVREAEIDYIEFDSGARATTDLLGEYIVEITEDGEPFINSSQFKPDIIKPGIVESAPKINQQASSLNKKSNTKSDNFSLSDLIKKQLDKNNEYIEIKLNIPVFKKDLFEILKDTHEEILTDLTKIIISKYINKEAIEELVKNNLTSYYTDDTIFDIKIIEKDIININTETI